jgi:acyl dehydratase
MIDPVRLLALDIPEVVHRYTRRDTILYALGVGMGSEPLSPRHLRYVYEADLAALPTMAVTLAYPGFWYRDLDTGLDFAQTVHGSERIVLHAKLPVEGTVVAKTQVVDLVDKGAGRGALVICERTICDHADGRPLATVRQTAFCRADGGFGGPARNDSRPAGPPDRPADHAVAFATSPRAALIYRLSGDPNPLHVDPAAARAAGFERPILHGLCAMGVVCHSAVGVLFGDEPDALTRMECRFTAPVFPGDSIRSEFWAVPEGWRFRASVADTVVAVGDLS